MKLLIVEDEPLAAVKLKKILAELDSTITVLGVTTTIKSTVQWLQQNAAPDLFLMDIELTDGQSFEIFEHAHISSPVVFTTSYDEFALKAFKSNGIDYLLKPVLKEELKTALIKYHKYNQKGNTDNQPINYSILATELLQKMQPKQFRNRFLVKHANRLHSIEEHRIAYFFCEGRLNFFKTCDNEKFVIDYTIDELENMVNPLRYFRINRAFFISTDSIMQIHDYPGNRLRIDLGPATNKEVIVSREKVTDFKKWIGK